MRVFVAIKHMIIGKVVKEEQFQQEEQKPGYFSVQFQRINKN